MKKALIALLTGFIVLTMLAIGANAQTSSSPFTIEAVVAQTGADSAGVLLAIPNSQQTILIKRIYLWYDNAANTNPFYAGIVTADAAHTRQLWIGQAMASSGIAPILLDNINKRIAPTTAQAGIRLFISAASSDSLFAKVDYELVPK